MTPFALGAFLFVSGFCGLVYELAWSKILTLNFGNSASAHALVLAVFLGGLALGNAALGPLADRVRRPLRLYACLELAIALCGALVPTALFTTADFFAAAVRSGAWAPGPALAARGAACALILLIPTVLMGGTLPAASRVLGAGGRSLGATLARLYFLNSAGGALGALTAGMLLIPALGLDLPGTLAGLLNALVGLLALDLSSRHEARPPRALPAAAGPEQPPVSARSIGPGALHACVFLSGVCSLAYELCWIRLLSLVLGSSVYSFTIMLSAFISGIALGSHAARSTERLLARPLKAFALSLIAAGLAVLGSLPFYSQLPFVFDRAIALVGRTPMGFDLFQGVQFVFAFGLMLVPTIFLGASLPLAAFALSGMGRDSRSVGGSIGRLLACNTAGNVLGALTAGLYLMPALGLRNLLAAAAGVQFLAGGLIYLRAREPREKRRFPAAAAALAGAALFWAFAGAWDPRVMTRGGFRHNAGPSIQSYREYRSQVERQSVLYYKDGAAATVSIGDFDGKLRHLRVNGKVDASTGLGDRTTQALIGHLPLLLRPESRSALVIGLGSGMTAAAMLAHPLERLDLAELSPEVVAASRYFEPGNGRPLEDKRLRLLIQDGRSLLKLGTQRYDAIVSEPSNPWMSGVADLFSVEFFSEAKSRLNEGGMVVQWLQAYELSDSTLRLVLRSFASVFPRTELWMLSRDLVLIGSEHPLPGRGAEIERLFAREGVRLSLRDIGIRHPTTLLALHMADDAGVRSLLGGPGPVHADRMPILDYAAPRDMFLARPARLLESGDPRRRDDPESRLRLTRYLSDRKRPLSPEEFAEIVDYHERAPGELDDLFLAHWLRRHPGDKRARWERARRDIQSGQRRAAFPLIEQLLEEDPRDPELLSAAADLEVELYLEERSFLGSRASARAHELLDRLESAAPERRAAALRKRAFLLEASGQNAQAAALLREAETLERASPALLSK